MNTFWTNHSGTRLASLLGVVAMVAVFALALSACGGDEAASGTDARLPVASTSPTETHSDIATGPSPSASGLSMAVSYAEPPLPPERAISPGTVGWKFEPTVDVEVTELGCYDADGDGLALAHRVGIFDGSTKRLLGSVTVRPRSTLDGAFRWESLEEPLVLQAGHFYLVGTADRTQVEQVGSKREKTCETCYDQDSAGRWAPEIAFGGLRTSYRLGGPEFTAPKITKQVNAFIQVAWMSPNFKFRPVAQD
jgi:hypothetical protein